MPSKTYINIKNTSSLNKNLPNYSTNNISIDSIVINKVNNLYKGNGSDLEYYLKTSANCQLNNKSI